MDPKRTGILFVLLCFLGQAFAQNRQLSGRVTAIENGMPIAGATVRTEDSEQAVSSADDGSFTLTIPPGGATLLVSSLGYAAARVAVGASDADIHVRLSRTSDELEDVVVVGYGTQSRRNVTGALSDIKSSDIVRSASSSTAGALAGKVQGLSVRAKDARPGRGASLEIRNMGTPLFVIDGVPYGGNPGNDWVQTSTVSGQDAFNALNLEDIENITILKDASAAVYGLRASSGVVLVTTKRGRKDGATKISLNGYQGWQNLTRFPTLANAAQYTRALVETAQNEGRDPTTVYTPEELAKWQSGTEPGYGGYDYYAMIVRRNIPQRYLNANVNGGTDLSSYFLSLGHVDQEAMIRDFSYNRTNLQSSLETKVLKGLSIGTQISARQEKSEDVGLPGGDGYFSSILAIFQNRPTVGPYANDNPAYPNHTNNFPYNPAIFSRDIAGYKDNMYRHANINLYARYATDFGLSAKGTVSYNYGNNKFDGFQYTYDVYTYEGNDVYRRSHGTDSRWRYQTQREVVSRYAQFQLDYNRHFGGHHLSGTLGYERSDFDRNYLEMGTNPSNNYLPLLEFDKMNAFNDRWDYEARAGYIGRANYNYKGRYLLELLGRYDASYLYAPGKEWGFFPGGSLGWRISDEPFFERFKGTVNDLKIRTSIGQTGKEEGVGLFGYLGGYTWNQGSAVLDGNFVNGLRPRGLPVTNLSWVKNTNYNIGVDMALLNNKLTLTADVFKIIRTGVPAARYDVLLPSEIGYGLPNENLNKNGYYGAEGMLTFSSKAGELDYTVSGNFTYSRYRALESYKPRFGSSWDEYRRSAEDRWGGIWWGYRVVGRFQSEEEIRNHPIDNDGLNNTSQLPGDFIYEDVNNDGVINNLDERPIGYPTGWTPMLSFGGRIGLNYKGIDLNIDLAGGALQSWFQDYELKNALHAGGNSPAYLLEDRWHRTDPYDPDSEWIPGYYPAIRNGNSGPNARNSDFWLTNVRYLRVRNLEIGYTMPASLLRTIKADRIRIYASASNLLSMDNVRKFQIDPEIEARAAVVYPQQRTFLVGFNFTF